MKRTILAFIGLAIAIYWMWTAELPGDRPASLAPMILQLPQTGLPGIARSPAPPDRMMKWLAHESDRMKVSGNRTRAVISLKQKALSLKSEDLASLHSIALDSHLPGDQRFLAVYVIGLSESAAARTYLEEISQSPVPTSPNEKGYTDEVTVRSHALETLVQRVNPEAAARILNQVLTRSNDPAMIRRAQYWLSRL